MPIEVPALLLAAPALLLVAQALLAPLETLLWSAGWIHDDPHPAPVHPVPAAPPPDVVAPRLFVVHLDGIGKTAPRETRVARELVGRLRTRLPDVAVLTHVMPYAMTNRAMLRRPVSGRYWRFLRTHHLRLLLFVNNVLQTFVACDPRYRSAYGRGLAHTIGAHLADAGHRPGLPVVLLGYSGGGQAAATAAAHLSAALGHPPLHLVFLGGFHDGTSDLTAVATVHAFTSRADVIERLGGLLFPARWRLLRRSAWNTARRRGVVVEHDLSPARHSGRRSYLSPVAGGDGTAPLDTTVDRLAALLADPAATGASPR